MPTATGKKARNAPSTATDSHRGHSQPPIDSRPPQLTTSGARAISGTVCDTTRYGSRPRRTTSKRAITVASAMPTARADDEPGERPGGTSTRLPASTTCQIGRSDVRLSSSNSRLPMSHTCGMAMSLVRGQDRPAEDLAAVVRSDRLVHLPHARPPGRAARTNSTDLAARQALAQTCGRRAPGGCARRRPASVASLASCWR